MEVLFCMGRSTGEPLEQRGHTKQGTAADALHKAGDTALCFKASLQCPEEHICHRACRQTSLGVLILQLDLLSSLPINLG